MMADMYKYQQGYERVLQHLWKSNICKEDKEGIEVFLRDQKARGKGYSRLIKLGRVLRLMAERLAGPFEKSTEDDIKQLVLYYETGKYTSWYKHDVKVILKQYYAWLNRGIYPQKVQWICTTMTKTEQQLINHGQLLTPEETEKIIDHADHPRNKALLAIMAESGARPGELGNLTIGRVNIDAQGVILNLVGKTGARRLRLVSSTPHLVAWLNNHAEKQNPHAPLWVDIGTKQHKQMTYAAMRKLVKESFKRAGVNKKAYPYVFRHSRANQLAHHLTEFQMNAYFGWVQGSDMPATYIHISGKDLDEHILRINGLKPDQTPEYKKNKNRICPRCNEINSPTALYCGKCAEIVDPALALKIQMQEVEKPVRNVKTPFLEWLQRDPEMRDVLQRKATEFKLNLKV